MSSVHCSYVRAGGVRCPNPPEDTRNVHMTGGDYLEVLVCAPHGLVWDAIKWADRMRQHEAST